MTKRERELVLDYQVRRADIGISAQAGAADWSEA